MPSHERALREYAEGRERLLGQIIVGLEGDGRFLAAWLTGSYGRGEEDAVSDIDLTVVVGPEADALCAHALPQNGDAPLPRRALFECFGELTLVHEQHAHAPTGGSFSAVLYAEPAVLVDWTLVPLASAARGTESRLLFDYTGLFESPAAIPAEPAAEPLPDALTPAQHASRQVSYFWMMSAITIKYILRRDALAFSTLYGYLVGALREAARFAGKEVGASPMPLPGDLTDAERLALVRVAGLRMVGLAPDVSRRGARVPPAPMRTLHKLFDLAEGALLPEEK